mmetsp:Transcript_18632/g.46739  ORF Transcript_18632/g.46739 Transcript_18632/m.46739 type:complete len:222 (-) Transcript_18632:118-783(-)
MRLVRHQPQHDEIRVEAVHAVPHRRAPLARRLEPPNEIHDLVLALAGDVGSGKDDRAARLPGGVRGDLVVDPVLEADAEIGHECGARGDAVGVEGLDVFRDVVSSRDRLCHGALGVLRAAKAARPLLVHLRARRDAVDREVHHFLGAHDPVEPLGVLEHALEHRLDVHDHHFVVVRMSALVDDTIHVEVKMVELIVVIQSLGYQRIAVGQPSKKLGDSHIR